MAENEKVNVNWESIIKDRMRPCIRLKEEDPVKRNAIEGRKRWIKKNLDKVHGYQKKFRSSEKGRAYMMAYEQKDSRKEYRREYERRPERIEYNRERSRIYREANSEEINRKKREYNASEKGKKANAEYGKKWRELNKEYDAERKSRWAKENKERLLQKKREYAAAHPEYRQKNAARAKAWREKKKLERLAECQTSTDS